MRATGRRGTGSSRFRRLQGNPYQISSRWRQHRRGRRDTSRAVAGSQAPRLVSAAPRTGAWFCTPGWLRASFSPRGLPLRRGSRASALPLASHLGSSAPPQPSLPLRLVWLAPWFSWRASRVGAQELWRESCSAPSSRQACCFGLAHPGKPTSARPGLLSGRFPWR